MTARILEKSPDLDFLYYSNDMIAAGGLLYLLDQGIDVPGQIGLAGFNGSELLDGFSIRPASMDAGCPHRTRSRAHHRGTHRRQHH